MDETDEVDLAVPRPLLDSLPDEDDAAEEDLGRAVEGLEERINRAIAEADDESEAAGHVLDAVEFMRTRAERFDEFVPELRAWGQSPIYAIAWRNLYADLVAQLEEHDRWGDRIDRERNARVVADGIRLSDAED